MNKFKLNDIVKVTNVATAGGPGFVGRIGRVVALSDVGLPYAVCLNGQRQASPEMCPHFAESELALVTQGVAHD